MIRRTLTGPSSPYVWVMPKAVTATTPLSTPVNRISFRYLVDGDTTLRGAASDVQPQRPVGFERRELRFGLRAAEVDVEVDDPRCPGRSADRS